MMPTRPGVVRAAPTVTRVPAFRLPSASLDRLRPARRGVLSPPLDRAAPRGAREEVAGQDRVGLAAEEGGPGLAVALGCGVDAVLFEDLPHGGGGDLDAEHGE